MPITVTATQGGTTANGMALKVFVLTQAAAVQNGATANTNFSSATTTHTLSITTTQTGSRVYGAIEWSVNSAATAAALTTVVDDVTDPTNSAAHLTFNATPLTVAPAATAPTPPSAATT